VGRTSTDRIEKQVVLRAPRAKVWRALADAPRFGAWFGVDLRGASFTPGARVRGRVTHPGYEHLTWEAVIERMEPERLLSWRWHPYAVDPKPDSTAVSSVPSGTSRSSKTTSVVGSFE